MKRYAIYYVPHPESDLWAFGSSVLGYDSATGNDVRFPDHRLFREPSIRAWTAAPRQYGFHATLKAPFELAIGKDEQELLHAARHFAEQQHPIEIGPLVVAEMGGFLGLVPETQTRALENFAADCVTEFDAFRAPMSEEDRAKRLRSNLTQQQVLNLDRWGYPYVFDQFRFHMTLTGRLPVDRKEDVRQALQTLYGEVGDPVTLDAVTVCMQPDRSSRFVVLQRCDLRER